MRTIKQILNSYMKPIDTGFPITSPLPAQNIKQISPFVMIEHQGPNTIIPVQKATLPEQNYPGVDRISLVFEGDIEYEDSMNNIGLVNAGDIQCLTDMPGIVRTEKIPESTINQGGKFHLVKIWIAHPQDFLFRPLKYQNIKKKDIPEINGDGFKLRIIAGESNGLKSPINSGSPVNIFHGVISAGKTVSIDIPENLNACLYVTLGEIKIMGEKIEARKLIWFNNDGDNIRVTADHDSEFLLLSGESLEQTMSQYYANMS